MPGPVLIIHDDVSVIAPAKRVLQREGIETLLVTNAADAVTAFEDLAPSVVVLAPSVDGGRGAAILRDIRTRRGGASVKVVLLGAPDSADPTAAVLTLPLDGRALLEAVGEALRPESVRAAPPSAAASDPPAAEPELELASPLVLDWFDALAAPEVPGLQSVGAADEEQPARSVAGGGDAATGRDFEVDDGSTAPVPAPGAQTAAAAPAATSESAVAQGGQAAELERQLAACTAQREAAAAVDADCATRAEVAAERGAELAAMQGELARLRGAQAEIEAELRRASEEREVLRALVDEAQTRREQEETHLEDARRAAAEAGAGLARLERAVAEDEARASEARERAESARAALERARAAAAADLQKAEEERHRFEAEAAGLEAERKEAQARAERTRRQREELRAAGAAEGARAREPAAAAPVAAPARPVPEAPRLAAVVAGPRPAADRAPVAATAPTSTRAAATRPASAPEIPFEGTLAALDAPALLCRIFAARATGRLEVEGEEATRTLWFEQGRLVAADSSALVERLEDVALRLGLIGSAQHHALRASEERNARRLAVRMVELGYIRPGEMVGLVRRRVEEIAWAVFIEERAPYRFAAVSPPSEERVVLPMHPFGLALEGVRRKYGLERLHARLGGPATLLRPGSAAVDVEAFGLAQRERAFVERVDGLRTVEELLLEEAIEELPALQTLYAMVAAGAIEIAVLGQPPLARSPKEALELDRARVAEKFAHAVGGDYFQILGLQRGASGYEVREARERLAREFDPARFAPADDVPLHERLDAIRQALAEAAEVLSNDALRAQYARQLVD